MRSARKLFSVLLVFALSLTLLVPTAFAANLTDIEYGAKAYTYVEQLSAIPRFVTYPGQELVAAKQVQDWLNDAGYDAKLQPFKFKYKNRPLQSQNVVAYRRADGVHWSTKRPLVVIGAHYDASPAGQGADDNASGVGVVVELAERLKDAHLDYDLAIVAFGAEEIGLVGSDYFVKSMSQADVKRCIAMINFDSLIAGDKLYIHAGFNRKTWARDAMLEIIEERGLTIEMQPGLNKKYPAGFTPNGFSDYTAFNKKGIPVVAFESTNWEIGDLDGYEQTELYGSFWHTPNDTLAKIEELFPGRPMERLHAYTELTYVFLSELEN